MAAGVTQARSKARKASTGVAWSLARVASSSTRVIPTDYHLCSRDVRPGCSGRRARALSERQVQSYRRDDWVLFRLSRILLDRFALGVARADYRQAWRTQGDDAGRHQLD